MKRIVQISDEIYANMALTVDQRPRLSPESISALVRRHYGLDGVLETLPAEWDQNFRLDSGEVGTFVVKVANAGQTSEVLELQNAALDWLAECGPPQISPTVVRTAAGESTCRIHDADQRPFRMRLLSYLPGEPLARIEDRSAGTLHALGRALGELDQRLLRFEHPAMERCLPWDLVGAEWISAHTHLITDRDRRGILERLLLQYRARVLPFYPDLPMSVIHNDANDENVLLARDTGDEWRVAGFLDFGDMLRSHTVNDLAICCAYALFGAEDPLGCATTIAAGYHNTRALEDAEFRVLFPLICIRLCVSVTISAIAAREDPNNEHRRISEEHAWEMLQRLETIDWRDAERELLQSCKVTDRPARTHVAGWSNQDLLSSRHQYIGPSLSLAYKKPLHIVRGKGQFLYDQDGRAYLDCVNNVCHVGHCHPKVVAAVSEQAALLNTNTRYLHPLIVEYARRLTDTLPEPLRVCFFVNSGSEANELAVRLARTHTGRRDLVVIDDAYHGNTTTLVELSPYKCEGPGGQGLADWAHKVAKPDPYRGAYRGAGESMGKRYAEPVHQTCARLCDAGHGPAAFLCEAILGCGGQIVPPLCYFQEAFAHMRAAGGVCIVDEVQVGFGRVGTHMWAFDKHDVVPDIVTLGKPMGNGHPLGAVITTAEIATSFANGMEFFSTFGGNPVSAAVGLAVLDVIEEEGLQQRADRVGRYLSDGFHALGERYQMIGDVRGWGLFLGVELVLDRDTRRPATKETAVLIEHVKTDGILLSAEGPDQNVLKIKPPLQFGESDADLLLGAVDRALSEIE